MPTTKKTAAAKKRVSVGKLSTPAKRLAKKDTKKVKGGIIAVLVGKQACDAGSKDA